MPPERLPERPRVRRAGRLRREGDQQRQHRKRPAEDHVGDYQRRRYELGEQPGAKRADADPAEVRRRCHHLRTQARRRPAGAQVQFGQVRGSGPGQSLFRPMFLPPQLDVGLEASGTFAAEPSNYPNGCHICEVEIDPETGLVTLARYASVGDVGKVINRLLCEGQIHGGVAQGVGQALMEAIVFDAEGQLVTGSFQDYAMPRAEDFRLVSGLPSAGDDQPTWHQGRRRSRRDRRAAAVISAILDALKPSASSTSTCRRRRAGSGPQSRRAAA